jgi:hypothetical protein
MRLHERQPLITTEWERDPKHRECRAHKEAKKSSNARKVGSGLRRAE